MTAVIQSNLFRENIICIQFHLGFIDNDRLHLWTNIAVSIKNLFECFDFAVRDLPLETHLLQSLYLVLWEVATCFLSLLLSFVVFFMVVTPLSQ